MAAVAWAESTNDHGVETFRVLVVAEPALSPEGIGAYVRRPWASPGGPELPC